MLITAKRRSGRRVLSGFGRELFPSIRANLRGHFICPVLILLVHSMKLENLSCSGLRFVGHFRFYRFMAFWTDLCMCSRAYCRHIKDPDD